MDENAHRRALAEAEAAVSRTSATLEASEELVRRSAASHASFLSNLAEDLARLERSRELLRRVGGDDPSGSAP